MHGRAPPGGVQGRADLGLTHRRSRSRTGLHVADIDQKRGDQVSRSFGKCLDVDLSSRLIGEHVVSPAWRKPYLGAEASRLASFSISSRRMRIHWGRRTSWCSLRAPYREPALRAPAGARGDDQISRVGQSAGIVRGGYFGHALGRSGYDGIIVRGKSEASVHLLLQDGVGQIRSADDLWGRQPERPKTRFAPGIGGCASHASAPPASDRCRSPVSSTTRPDRQGGLASDACWERSG